MRPFTSWTATAQHRSQPTVANCHTRASKLLPRHTLSLRPLTPLRPSCALSTARSVYPAAASTTIRAPLVTSGTAAAVRDSGPAVMMEHDARSVREDAATGASSTPSPQPLFGEGNKGRVVVIGAGLVGVLAASLFAKKGYQVAVFEKRGAGPPSAARSFPMTLNWRAIKATVAAGLDPTVITKYPLCGGFVGSNRLVKFPQWIKSYMVDRIGFGQELVAAAQQQYPKEISFHFGYEVSDLDVARRTVKVAATSDGVPALGVDEVSYDLLVAADGNYSRTRSLLQQQDPDLDVSVPLRSAIVYFSFHNLPVADQLPWSVDQPGNSSDDRTYIRVSQPTGFATPGLSFWKTPNGSFSGLGLLPLTCKYVPAWVAELVDNHTPPNDDQVQEIKALLHDAMTCVPKEWHEAIFQQVANAKLGVMGRTVKCNKFTSSGVLLLGDAAHGVTASLGQGANVAMEDVSVLSQVLDEMESKESKKSPMMGGRPGGRIDGSAVAVQLDAVSAEYEHRRMADVQAAQTVDVLNGYFNKQPVKKEKRSFIGSVVFAWQLFAYRVSWMLGMALAVAVPSQTVFLPAGFSFHLPISYQQAFARFQVQVAILLAPIVAVVGWFLMRLLGQ